MSLRVISASRRIDMVGTSPDALSAALRAKFPPSSVHTLVLWTKNPGLLLGHGKLRETVSGYRQVFVHCTVTGMGSTGLEPRVPQYRESLSCLPELVELVGRPERVRLRFDPIVHLTAADTGTYSNLPLFEGVVSAAGRVGLPVVIVSWVQSYPKVERRLRARGIRLEMPAESVMREELSQMQASCTRAHVRLLGCCAPGLPAAKCIDGELFNAFHPLGLTCSEARAGDQRAACSCTTSLDIGWYKPCVHGCLYCYANPGVCDAGEP
ncbi:MAG: DUF1848 family protein [Candidatus Eisenbacteria bacterium]